jgi:hypothetical protein
MPSFAFALALAPARNRNRIEHNEKCGRAWGVEIKNRPVDRAVPCSMLKNGGEAALI